MKTEQEILKELNLFNGSENYFKIPFSDCVYTDGVRELIKSCGCWWLVNDLGILLKFNPIDKPFLIVGIKVNEDKTALITLKEDTDEIPVYEKLINYTDFPLKEFEFYLIDKVFLLKGEY